MSGYLCDECRPPKGDGWHYRTDPANPDGDLIAEPCPSKAAARQEQHTRELAKLAHESAWEAAKRIVADAAETRLEFSANDLAEELEQIPETSLHGSAFTWAAKSGLIEPTGRMVMHRDPATRHRITVWRSLVHRAAAS